MSQKDTKQDVFAALDAERALIGAVLQDPIALRRELADFDPAWLFRADHQHLLRQLVAMNKRGQMIDLVTLPQELERSGRLAMCGGVSYVLDLPNYAPSTANVSHYADLVRECFARREIRRHAERLQGLSESEDIPDLREQVIERSRAMLAAGEAAGDAEDFADVVDKTIDLAEAQHAASLRGELIEAPVVSTGWDHLDDAMGGGLRRGQVTVIAGRPGMGKTAMLLELARNLAEGALDDNRDRPERVLICSLEMTPHELAQRALSRDSGVSHQGIARGMVPNWGPLMDAHETVRRLPIRVWHRPSPTTAQIIARIYSEASKHPLRAVMIDYAQLIRMTGSLNMRRDLELSESIASLKAACGEVDAALVLLSQFGRGIERNGGIPTMSALKESGGLEEHAHTILGLDRPGIRGCDMAAHWLNVYGLKCRSGSPFALQGVFDGRAMRIEITGPLDAKMTEAEDTQKRPSNYNNSMPF